MNYSFTQLLLSLLKPPQQAIPQKKIFPKANYHPLQGQPEKVDRPTLGSVFKTSLPSAPPFIGTHLNGSDLKRHFVASTAYQLAYNQRKSKSFYNEGGTIEQISFESRNRPWQEKRLHLMSTNNKPMVVSSRSPRESFENKFFSTAKGTCLPRY